jgi:hypothetical protein
MAQMKNKETMEIVYLNSQHLIGRNSRTCNTYLKNEDVSRAHGTIHWSNGNWFIQDHSRNGTLVNGVVIRKASIKLGIGDEMQFGRMDLSKWKILDLHAPLSYLRSLKNKIVVLETCHAFPNEKKPDALIYRSKENNWVAETKENTWMLEEGRNIRLGNEEWQFVENENSPDTLDYGETLKNSYFKFELSTDEEDIQIKIIIENEEISLGRRSHNYLLLTLARKRLADFHSGFELNEQGWVSIEALEKDVSKELGYEVDAYYLNLQIFRLRKQLTKVKPFGHLFTNTIERRAGELRFAFPQLRILKKNICVGKILEI